MLVTVSCIFGNIDLIRIEIINCISLFFQRIRTIFDMSVLSHSHEYGCSIFHFSSITIYKRIVTIVIFTCKISQYREQVVTQEAYFKLTNESSGMGLIITFGC